MNNKINFRTLIRECITEVLHERHIRRQQYVQARKQELLDESDILLEEIRKTAKEEFGI